VGLGFFPLDEALGLGGSRYSGQALSWMARLGAELPFARAACWLREVTGIAVRATTVRRHTEALGATVVARTETEVADLLALTSPETERSVQSAAPDRLVLGVDGAMVPLRHGEWAEVKLVSVGVPTATGGATPAVRTTRLSYFARLADADTFATQALGELHRRGLDSAAAVAAVQDGAPWLQGFVDYHRPDAVRILDWPHAAEHLTAVAEACFGGGMQAMRAATRLRTWLWQEGPTRVCAVLDGWQRAHPAQAALATAIAYFRERRAHLDYPAFRAAGWPVGSGATESGHKQVMQARMKRAGMHWSRAQVNPLLALTLLEHNGRWASEGPTLLTAHRAALVQRRRQRQQTRRHAPQLPRTVAPAAPMPPPPQRTPLPTPTSPPPPFRHPWRRYGAPLSAKN